MVPEEGPWRAADEEEEDVGRSGDVGMAHSLLESDPWASGRMEKRRSHRFLSQSFRRRDDEWDARSGDSGRSADTFPPSLLHSTEGGGIVGGEEQCGGSERLSSSWRQSLGRPTFSFREHRNSSLREVPVRTSSFDIALGAISSSPPSSLLTSPPSILPPPAFEPALDMPMLSDLGVDDATNGANPHLEHASESPSLVRSNKLYFSLKYASNLASLAAFGILGVLIRYGLGFLFGDILQVVGDNSPLYTELPANLVGSFFMGWVGIVLKKSISEFSEALAIGLSTGLMGSITTFASWNQRMIALTTRGHWVSALLGYIIGMELSQMSLLVGVDAAKLLKWSIMNYYGAKVRTGEVKMDGAKLERPRFCTVLVFLLVSSSLWVGAVALSIIDNGVKKRQSVWVACVVAPLGVWIRWHLARLNGKGVGSKLKWLPVGTLLANLIAAGVQAALAVVLFTMNSWSATVVNQGLQLGLLGCMSTVSTFVTEVYTMYGGPTPARAFLYTLATLLPAFFLGIFLYSIPSWAKGYV